MIDLITSIKTKEPRQEFGTLLSGARDHSRSRKELNVSLCNSSPSVIKSEKTLL